MRSRSSVASSYCILRRIDDEQYGMPAIVERLKVLRTNEHKGQNKVARCRLCEAKAGEP